MKREEYRTSLEKLPIKNPTTEDIARICPHLTADEVAGIFDNDSIYIACPPLLIRNGFQIVTYKKERIEELEEWQEVDGKNTRVITGTKTHPPQLRWSFASRTLASYKDNKPHGDLFTPYRYMEKAMRFAEDNWRDELILDDWTSVVTFYVQDPTDLINDRYHRDQPRTKAVLYVTLNRELNDIINDGSKPESELFDDAIAQMTLDPFIWHEIKGGRGEYTEFNCAHCDSGLSLSSCKGCGNKFKDDQFRCGWSTPLSRKMVRFLRENGHVFGINPEIAFATEKQRYLGRQK